MERLYLDDSHLKEFNAEITSVTPRENGLEITLSRSAFYPESGGQPADKGWINTLPVKEIIEKNGDFAYITAPGDLSVGQDVSCRIDWDRRFDHMQHHTGQHILSQAFIEEASAETVSFHLSRASATIDLAVETLSEEKLKAAELRANRAITDNLPVKIYSIEGSEQQHLPVRKPSARKGLVRIVEISGWDYSPCGGTHCDFTGEVGLIKILRLERVRQQLRIHFCCGKRALLDYRRKNELVAELGQILSCGEDDLADNVQKQIENSSSFAKKLQKLQSRMMGMLAEQMKNNTLDIGGFSSVIQYIEGAGLKDLNKLASSLLQEKTADIVLLAGDDPRPGILLASTGAEGMPDLREVLREVQPMFDGKGGGSPDRVQAGGNDSAGLLPALEKAKELIIQGFGG